MAQISLSGIDKYFGRCHALRDVSVEIEKGEFFSLLGPSGSGKTTLLKTISGVEVPDRGQVRIDGKETLLPASVVRPGNMVFLDNAIFAHLSLTENIGFGLQQSGLDRVAKARVVGDAMETVGLEKFGACTSHGLSEEERLRVALARALVLKPAVLLLDDPIGAPDKKSRARMQTDLRRLQRQIGITFIMSTRDPEEALMLSDRVAVMFDGEIAQLASPQSLYHQPNSRRVGEFVGRMNLIRGRLDADGARLIADIPGLGRMPIDSDFLPAGQKAGPCTFGLRPEAMSLVVTGGLPTGKFVDGVVLERSCHDDTTQYELLLDGADKPVRCAMQDLPDQPVLKPGDRSRLAWEPGGLIVLGDS